VLALKLKKETHASFGKLFEKFSNVRDWKINFEYDWGVSSLSWIDKEDNGRYDKLIEEEENLDE